MFRAEMSLIHPRPLLMEYLALCSPEQARRHNVLPGISGCAPVNGRDAISWEEKFRLDVWSVDHRSFWFDVRILWMTLARALRRSGVAAPSHSTTTKFTGDKT